MSKSKKNKSIDETTTENVVDIEDTVESTETATEDSVATEETTETETPVTTTEETATEVATEKDDTSSKEATPTETVVETPAAEKTTETSVEAKTEQSATETVEEKKEETAKEPAAEITLATVLRVRFCSLFSNKRLATRRNMPLYNIIYTHIHNRASYIGLCNGERYDDVVKYIQNNTITIESTKLSDKLKEQIIRKLKQDTDYAKIKWGNVDKQ